MKTRAPWYFWPIATAILIVPVTAFAVFRPGFDGFGVPSTPITPVAEFTGSPFLSPEPVAVPEPRRDGPPRSVVGAVYPVPPVATRPAALRGVPFTFLLPDEWSCAAAQIEPPMVVRWRCAGGEAGLDLLVHRCDLICTEWDRAGLQRLVRDPVALNTVGASTRYGERLVADRYVLEVDLVDVARVSPWVVHVVAEGPATQTATVQSIVNDIYSQTVSP